MNQKPVDQSLYNEEWAKRNPFWVYGFDEKAKRRSEGIAPYLIMETFDLWDGKKVLDAGCGFGYLAKFLSEFGADVIGLDYSDYFVDNKVYQNIVKADMTNLPCKDKSFDLVISRENFEHLTVEQADQAFEEMVRVSKKWIYMTIWINHDKDASDTEVLSDLDSDPTHITFATRKFWLNRFQKYVDDGTLVRREDKEAVLDWKGKKRVFVYEVLR